ncbi:aldehyde dehydrogenase family protein [Methylobacterium sp. J-070]|uniref:aldehyde dehydrogenase family protein n=1 Tax=Methylobacterium sp. J-070 TaxID=2836650 RepID=UPI001FBA5727|nr:aldehyde dehydrogenase family protein [Methylobacterium sp. J-070]MCJ2048453.1 aldehyde dehydrogenase family protein [Methylobacterium sp. J-070]
MNTPQLNFKPRGLFVGGRWVDPAEGRSFTTINPSNKDNLGDVPFATEADVDRTVAAAKDGFREWSRVTPKERARCLELLAKRIEEHADELALMDAVDSGNAIVGMRGDMTWTSDTLRYFAGLITEIKGDTSTQGPRHLNLTRRQPYGVVAKINPFNHPFRFCAEKAAAPLAAGNCVVIKGSEQAPLSSLRLGELCEGIFPAGVVNVITGDAVTGSALVRHRDVQRIGLVGSVATGRAIAREAAAGLKRVSLELGGKNPIIIFPDSDPKKAAAAAIKGMNMNRQGQSCSSTSRVLVHASLHEAVAEEIVKLAEALPIGAPWLRENDVGPIVSERQFDRIMDFIESAKSEGAKLLTGGGRPSNPDLQRGFFIAPTVFDNVTPSMRIGREEIFGPVMSIMPWGDYEDMLATANGLEYGLTAAIVTNDLAKAMETAERIEAGYVWINSTGRYLGSPYGGWKQSGLGEEECFDEMLSYTQTKNINMRW